MEITPSPKVTLLIQSLISGRGKGQAPRSPWDQPQHPLKWHQSIPLRPILLSSLPFYKCHSQRYSWRHFLKANFSCKICFPMTTKLEWALRCDSESWFWHHYWRRKWAHLYHSPGVHMWWKREPLPVIFKLWGKGGDYRLLWDSDEWCGPLGFPGSSDGKESACNSGDSDLIPGTGRSPGEGNGYPLQFTCLENSMDRGARLQSMGSQRVRHDWTTNTHTTTSSKIYAHIHTHRQQTLLEFQMAHGIA